MTLKERIAARLKAIAAGVNLSKTRIDAIVARAEKGLTDDSEDAKIDENLNAINELTPFKDIASLDDHERAKAKKIADDKEAKRLADIAAGKMPEDDDLPADTPEWAKAFMKSQKAETDALKAKLAEVEGDKVAKTRREQFIKSMEGTSKEYQDRELKKFDRFNFKDDEDFNAFIEELKPDHAAAAQAEIDSKGGGFAPGGGVGGPKSGTKEASEAEVEEVFANIKI